MFCGFQLSSQNIVNSEQVDSEINCKMSRNPSTKLESKGKKVVVLSSEDYYSLSPIKVLQPNEKVDPVKKAPAFCNRIVFGSKGKENGTSVLGCEICRFNRPSSSSHFCIDIPESSDRPKNKQANILKKARTPKTAPAPRSEDYFTTEVHGLVKKSADTGKVQKKKYVRKSKGPKSTSSLVKDMTPTVNFQIDFTPAVKSYTPTQGRGDNLAKFELRHGVLEKIGQSVKSQKRTYKKKSESPKRAPKVVETPNPRGNFFFIDLTTSDPVSSIPASPTQTSNGNFGVRYNGSFDETAVMDLVNKQYGSVLETQFFSKNIHIDDLSTKSVPPSTNSTFSLSVDQPEDTYELPSDPNQYRIKEEQLIDQLEKIGDVKAVDGEAYNKYFGSYSLLDSPDGNNKLFTLDELKIVPDKIFESPAKIKEQSPNVSPNEFLKNPNFHLSKMILEDPNNSVEIKREIINNTDLLDEDILEVFTVPSANAFDTQSYIIDPTICITFEDVKHPENHVLIEEKRDKDLQVINSKSGVLNESAMSADILEQRNENIPQNTNKPFVVSSSMAPPGELKFWEIAPDDINFDVKLGQSSLKEDTIDRNNNSPLTELLDIVFSDLDLEEPIKNASEVVELLEREAELFKSANNICKAPNGLVVSSETAANNPLSRKSANSFVTEFINSGMELSICRKSVETTKETRNVLGSTSESSSLGNHSKSFTATVSVQTEESFLGDPPKYFDSFQRIDEAVPISEAIVVCSEIDESTNRAEDILEKALEEDIAAFLSKTKENASASPEGVLETSTNDEATKACILDRNINADVLDVIQSEHSYGRVSDVSDTSELVEAATGITSDNIFTDINNCRIEPVNVEGNDNKSKDVASAVENMTNEVEKLPLDSQNTNINNRVVLGEASADSSSSRSTPTVITDSEIAILKTKIMEGTINKEEILEIIEGKNIQCYIPNPKLDQQKCDIRHLGGCLKKQIDVMRKTYDYFDDIVEAAMKDLDRNVTEANVRNILDNLHFVKDMVDKTFAYYDMGRRREKKVKYRVINITKKEVASAQKNAGATTPASTAPLGTRTNIARKTVTKPSNKLLTRTLYRMNKLLDLLEKRKGLMRSRKPNGFVSKLREIARKEDNAERSKAEVRQAPAGEDKVERSNKDERLNVVTRQKQVGDPLEEPVVAAVLSSQTEVKPTEKGTILTSLENIPREDINVVSKITPMNRDIKIILSQIDKLNKFDAIYSERNGREEIHSLLERKSTKISESKVEGTAQDEFVDDRGDDKNNIVSEQTSVTSTILDNSVNKKNFNKWTISKVPKNDTRHENITYNQRHQKISSNKEDRELPTEKFNNSRYSRRSRKPPGFYSESKVNSKELTLNKNTSPQKYEVDCTNLNLNVTHSKINNIDLAYELKNDNKPCVILYNKKDDVKVPIFEKFRQRYEKYRITETSAAEQTVKISANNVNGKTDEPKTVKVKVTETKIEPNQKGRVLRKTERVDTLPRRSLRSATMKERNAAQKLANP